MICRLVSREGWIEALNASANRVRVDLHGFPLYYETGPGWRVKNRLPGQHLLYLSRSGSFHARIGGQRHQIAGGELAWVQPDTPFDFHADGRLQLARFRLEITDARGRPICLKRPQAKLRESWMTHSWLDQLRTLAGAAHPWPRMGLRACLAGFFASLFEAEEAAAQPARHTRRLSPRQAAKLENAVELAPRKPWASADLAALLQLSTGYFNRLFRATYGRSARAWLMERRLHAAALQLRETSCRVGDAAQDFGYSSLYLFSRQFRSVMGVGPRAYRRRENART